MMRYKAIVKRLNADFWNVETIYGGLLNDCYGRETAIEGVNEINMLFEIPSSLKSFYEKSNDHCLFKDVLTSVCAVYPNTHVREEINGLEIIFSDKMCFNLHPVFLKDEKSYMLFGKVSEVSRCIENPQDQINLFKEANHHSNGALFKLCRIVRSWKEQNDVVINDMLLDTLIYRFVTQNAGFYNTYADFSFLCRDFFNYLSIQNGSIEDWKTFHSGKYTNSENFRHKATIASHKATAAIQQEKENRFWLANQKWREVFGCRFPDVFRINAQINGLLHSAEKMCHAHQKCKRILKRKVQLFRGAQLLLSGLILISLLIMEYTEQLLSGLVVFSMATIVFFVNLYFKKNDLTNIGLKHLRSASKLQTIKKEIHHLLVNLHSGTIEVDVIREHKEGIKKRMLQLYGGTSKFISTQYLLTTRELKIGVEEEEKVLIEEFSTVSVPTWQASNFNIENKVQCLMNAIKLLNLK